MLSIYVGFQVNMKTGVFAGSVVFFMCGGFEIFYLYKIIKSKGREEKEKERKKLLAKYYKDTEDNPTLR